jgi:hypothetical protein
MSDNPSLLPALIKAAQGASFNCFTYRWLKDGIYELSDPHGRKITVHLAKIAAAPAQPVPVGVSSNKCGKKSNPLSP